MAQNNYYVVRRGSTSLTNKIILSGLSYEALGLLMTELSLKPGTPLGYREMVGRGAGESRVRKAHAELEKAGLRHRYLARVDGRLRSITIVTDEPASSDELLDEIDLPDGAFIVKVESVSEAQLPAFESRKVEGSGRHKSRSDCAVKNTAQSDLGKRQSCVDSNNSQNRRSDCAVMTAAQKTAAQFSTAGRSPNPLRVKDYPSSPQPPIAKTEEGAAAPLAAAPNGAAGEGGYFSSTTGSAADCVSVPALMPQGSSVSLSEGFESSGDVIPPVEALNQSQRAVSLDLEGSRRQGRVVCDVGEDWALIRECLPECMRALPPREVRSIADLLRHRLAAGWSAQQIHSILAARVLPERVRTLTGLVKARLRDDVPEFGAPPRHAQVFDRAQETRESQALQQARREFACDQKAGALPAQARFDSWLTQHYPDLVKVL